MTVRLFFDDKPPVNSDGELTVASSSGAGKSRGVGGFDEKNPIFVPKSPVV
jgi:hypothetical protein